MLKDIVLIGGGHAHVHVLKSFGMRPMPGVRLTLVTRDVETPYSGMLPGLIAGHYRHEQCHIDLAPLARFAGARLIHADAVGLDRAAGRVLLADRPPLAYDLVSLNTGITPRLSAIDGAERFAVPVKPIGRFLGRWREIEARALAASGGFRLVTVGAGAGGVELLLAARHRLRALVRQGGGDPDRLAFHLIGSAGVLPSHAPAVGATFTRILAERGVEVWPMAGAVAIERSRIVCGDGRTAPADVVLLVTEAQGAPWLANTGLRLDAQGCVVVGDTLQALDDPAVLAAGDMASMLGQPRPKAGVFAVRQGPPLAANLRRLAQGRT
ncbi:MAG: FAD-dependent oxidoreductase, partial [Actinomycetota bacterium]|nr:FAD-dependent oxidoreductase [Actinomycetota bacterium]